MGWLSTGSQCLNKVRAFTCEGKLTSRHRSVRRPWGAGAAGGSLTWVVEVCRVRSFTRLGGLE